MKYRECPEWIQPWDKNTLFLAGGITGCPDWQSEIRVILENTDLTLINPRRKDFDVSNKDMEREQIHWEHRELEDSDMISFWFPKETLCPITLFELGKYIKSEKKVFLGIHPDYKRKRDLEIQIPLVRANIDICYSIKDLAATIQRW